MSNTNNENGDQNAGKTGGKKDWNDRAADALRANLRRRKQQKRNAPSPSGEDEDDHASESDGDQVRKSP